MYVILAIAIYSYLITNFIVEIFDRCPSDKAIRTWNSTIIVKEKSAWDYERGCAKKFHVEW